MSLLVISSRKTTSVAIEPWRLEPLTNHVQFLRPWWANLLMTEYWNLPRPSTSFSFYKSGAKYYPYPFANGRRKETNLCRMIQGTEKR